MLITFQIFLWLFTAAFSYRFREELMSTDDIQYLFGNREGRIPDYDLFEFILPTRFKRASPSNFAITLDVNGQYYINVNVQKIMDNYLIGQHTNVWYAKYNRIAHNSVQYQPKPWTLTDLGDIDFYQDVGTDSAITLFNYLNGSKHLSGIIHARFGIKNLEYSYIRRLVKNTDWLNSHAIKMRSLDSNSDENKGNPYICLIYKLKESSHDDLIQKIHESKIYHERTKRQARTWGTTVVYPKIALTFDFESTLHSISKDLTYLITYWNAVDMIYRKMTNPQVRLCLTSIIIPMDSRVTSYIAPDTSQIYEISARTTGNNMRFHFNSENARLPLANYDIIVLMTMRFLCADQLGSQCFSLEGYSNYRKLCDFSPKTSVDAFIISRFDWSYGAVSVMAHELGHVFGASDHDGESSAISCPELIGNIMTPVAPNTRNLVWSSCSAQTISTFLGSANRSCLRIPPFQVRQDLADLPGSWLSLKGQCQNYDSAYSIPCRVSNPNICVQYGCGFAHYCLPSTIPPLDGTTCLASNNKIGYCKALNCNPL